jgi:hypothetical protein
MNIKYRIKGAWDVFFHGAKVQRRRKSIPPISPEELTDIKAFFPMDKFFILGHSRSGNTLLMRLCRLHPEVHANYQATFFSLPPGIKSLVDSVEIEAWLTKKSNYWNHGRDLSPVVMRAAADFIMENDARKYGKHIVGDKSPTTVTAGAAVKNMYQLYPDAKMVYIVRDGRDVMVSDRFRNFVENRFLRPGDDKIIDAFRRDPSSFTNGTQSIFTETWLRDKNQGVPSWEINLRESETEGRQIYGTKFYPIRYEDILDHPFEEMKKLWLFLGVKDVDSSLEQPILDEININPDEKWQAEKDGSLASILPKGQPGNWKSFFSQRDREIYKEIAGELLIKWGYEKDKNW